MPEHGVPGPLPAQRAASSSMSLRPGRVRHGGEAAAAAGACCEDAEQVVYLDPDTYVTSPMVELAPAAGGLGTAASSSPRTSSDRRRRAPTSPTGTCCWSASTTSASAASTAGPCRRLDWWWSHLQHRVPLRPAGRPVRRPEVDGHRELALPGGQLPPRRLQRRASPTCGSARWRSTTTATGSPRPGERLRLFHFHAFDSSTPEKLSLRAPRLLRAPGARTTACCCSCARSTRRS